MWIRRARVDGFGRLRGRSLEFSRGLNCIHGCNESGKTTLMRFIISMLYGQAKPGLQRRELDETHERYAPWQGGAYGGSLEIALADGNATIVKRDLSGAAEGIEMVDATSGRSVLEQFERSKRREYQFMRAITGVSKRVFTGAFVVDHDSIAGLSEESKHALADRLASLVQSGDETAGAEKAHETLGRLLEEIGSERAPTRPLAKTLAALEEARRELEDTRKAHEEYAGDLEKKAALEARTAALEAEILTCGALLYRSIAAHVRAVEEEQKDLKEDLASLGPAELPGKLASLDAAALRRAETALVEFVGKREAFRETQSRAAELAAQAERMQRELDESFRTIQAMAEEHRTFLASASQRKSEILEELSTTKDSVAEAEKVAGKRSTSNTLAAVMAVAGVAGAVGAYMFAQEAVRIPFAAAAAVIGFILAAIFWLRGAGLGRKLAELEPAKKKHEELEATLGEFSVKLNEALGALGVETPEEANEVARELDTQKQALTRVSQELSSLSENVEKQKAAAEHAWLAARELLVETGLRPSQSLEKAAERLLAGAESAGGASSVDAATVYTDVAEAKNVSKALQPVYSRLENASLLARKHSELNSRLAESEGRMKEILAGTSKEEVFQREAAAGEIPAGTALLAVDKVAAERQKLRSLEDERAEVQVESAKVTSKVEEGLKGFVAIADVEDRISVLEERNRLQVFWRSSIEEAERAVVEAMSSFHDRIFPRLEESLSGLLTGVTLGAHESAKLWTDDEEKGAPMNLSVFDDIKGAPVAPEALSQGACEQLYLCARLALIDALSQEDTSPIMLDDPFINYDPERLQAALSVVGQVAEKHQLFLFTCQDDVRDLAAAAGAKVIALA